MSKSKPQKGVVLDNINFKNHSYEPLPSKELDNITFTSQGYSVHYKPYLHEVMANITHDMPKIKQKFKFDGEVKSVDIKQAGSETHYNRKVPLFLEFTICAKQEPIKIVYKPRSVEPEIILEDLLSRINATKIRPILNCDNIHGYDSFIEGNVLKGTWREFASQVCALCSEKTENANLILALKHLGIEDTHPENFLLDNNNQLHFIDAEVYQTLMAANVDDIYSIGEKVEEPKKVEKLDLLANFLGNIKPTFVSSGSTIKSEGSFEEKTFPKVNEKAIIELAKEAKIKLQNIPTRLVICSTQLYATPGYPISYVTIGPVTISNVKDGFSCYHTAKLAEFLNKHNFIKFEKKDDFKSIQNKISNAFDTKNPIDKINAEIKEADALKDQGELPAFRFHLSEKWIECPLTQQKLQLKKQNEV